MRNPPHPRARRAPWLAWLFAWVLALVCGGAPARADSGPLDCTDLPGLLRAGAPLVLIVAAPPTAAERQSEAYGDWESYRDIFLARDRDRPCAIQVTPDRYRAHLDAPVLATRFATLFIRPGWAGMLYSGLVLEPDVYQAGITFVTAGDTTPGAAWGLVPVSVKPRQPAAAPAR